MKVLHKEFEDCSDCPYGLLVGSWEHTKVKCLKTGIISSKYKFGQDIKPLLEKCPLPDKASLASTYENSSEEASCKIIGWVSKLSVDDLKEISDYLLAVKDSQSKEVKD